MKPLSKVIIVISFLLFTVTCLPFSFVQGWLSTVNAAVPHLINYQGRLTDSSSVPLNGSYQLTFRILKIAPELNNSQYD